VPARERRPADSFKVGERIRFNGENATVTERIELDGKKSVCLGIRPDHDKIGDRWVFASSDLVEEGDPLRRGLAAAWVWLGGRVIRQRG